MTTSPGPLLAYGDCNAESALVVVEVPHDLVDVFSCMKDWMCVGAWHGVHKKLWLMPGKVSREVV